MKGVPKKIRAPYWARNSGRARTNTHPAANVSRKTAAVTTSLINFRRPRLPEEHTIRSITWWKNNPHAKMAMIQANRDAPSRD